MHKLTTLKKDLKLIYIAGNIVNYQKRKRLFEMSYSIELSTIVVDNHAINLPGFFERSYSDLRVIHS